MAPVITIVTTAARAAAPVALPIVRSAAHGMLAGGCIAAFFGGLGLSFYGINAATRSGKRFIDRHAPRDEETPRYRAANAA